jgi:hypothetical protein
MLIPARDDGLPDMEAAISLLGAIEAKAVDRYIEKMKDAPLPVTRKGSSGTRTPDMSDDATRLAIANQVAARSLESGI